MVHKKHILKAIFIVKILLLIIVLFIPEWWINLDLATLKMYYPHFGSSLFFYIHFGLYLHILIIVAISVYYFAKHYLKVKTLLKNFHDRKFQSSKINLTLFLAFLLFSTMSIMEIRFFPSIIFPDFKNFYTKDHLDNSSYILLKKVTIIDASTKKKIDLLEFQKPKEIHNYMYLMRYLIDDLTKDNAIQYIQKRTANNIILIEDSVKITP